MIDNPRRLSWKSLGHGILGFSLQSHPPGSVNQHIAGFCEEEMPGSNGELKDESGDEVFFDGCHALLRFERPGSTLAQAQGFHDVWSFKRCGVWQPWISIRRVGKDRDLGVFRIRSGQPGQGRWTACLVFRQGGNYRMEGTDEGVIRLVSSGDRDGQVLMEMGPAGLPMEGADVRVSRDLGTSDTFLFAAFLWYIMVLSAIEERSGPFLESLGLGSLEPEYGKTLSGCV